MVTRQTSISLWLLFWIKAIDGCFHCPCEEKNGQKMLSHVNKYVSSNTIEQSGYKFRFHDTGREYGQFKFYRFGNDGEMK